MKLGDITVELIKIKGLDDSGRGMEYTVTGRIDGRVWRIEGRRYKGGKIVSNVICAADWLTFPESDGGTRFVRIWEMYDDSVYDQKIFKKTKEQMHEHFQGALERLKAAVEALP